MANTCIPHIVAGIDECNRNCVLIVEWTIGTVTSFDFVMVPKSVCGMLLTTEERLKCPDDITLQRDEVSNQLKASWTINNGARVSYCFANRLIPESFNVKCLPIHCYSIGDLLYLMEIQGRGNFASCKCVWCNLSRSNVAKPQRSWANPANRGTGTIFTVESMQQESKNYK